MELPKRKEIRLKNYNYDSNGSYFITFCVQDKKQILSSIHVGALHEAPAVELTEYGKAVKNVIETAEERFGINIDGYVIMPNHVHIIIQSGLFMNRPYGDVRLYPRQWDI